jgi:hypothetical protein
MPKACLARALKAGDIDPLLERGYGYEICDQGSMLSSDGAEAFLGAATIDLPLPSD